MKAIIRKIRLFALILLAVQLLTAGTSIGTFLDNGISKVQTILLPAETVELIRQSENANSKIMSVVDKAPSYVNRYFELVDNNLTTTFSEMGEAADYIAYNMQ